MWVIEIRTLMWSTPGKIKRRRVRAPAHLFRIIGMEFRESRRADFAEFKLLNFSFVWGVVFLVFLGPGGQARRPKEKE